MKKIFFLSALVAVCLVSCKKEIVNTPVAEGANVVATKVGSFKTEEEAPRLWFTGNFTHLMMSLESNGRGNCILGKCFCTKYSLKITTPSGSAITSELVKLGNSHNYRSGNLNIPENLKYQLVDLEIVDCDGKDFYKGQVFIYESGQTIEQNPEVTNVEKIGQWTHSSGNELIETLVMTISGDPAMKVEKLLFVPDKILIETGDPKNPFKTIELPSVELEKTHFSQSTGVARFSSMNKIRDTYEGFALPKNISITGKPGLVAGGTMTMKGGPKIELNP